MSSDVPFRVPSDVPFRYRFRVRYGECDGQLIVFNARYGDYADIAITEYQRAIWGVIQGPGSVEMKLVKQTTEWTAPARFDDVIEALVSTVKVGTTSFTIRCEMRRWPALEALVIAETIYVAVEGATGAKRPITAGERAALERGALGALVDHAATGAP